MDGAVMYVCFGAQNELSQVEMQAAIKARDAAHWAAESSYFRDLHNLLPEPFFHTSGFLGFLLFVAIIYWLTPRNWTTARVLILLIASFHFYAAWNSTLAFLVTITASADYFLAQQIEAQHNKRYRRYLVIASVAMNLGVLGYFKYRGFFLNELHDFLSWFGRDPQYRKLSPLDIIVPFGISFYTFEAISYIVDVSRGKIKAEQSLPHFLLFILFFPHLVAGPIVRAGDFLRQTRRIKRWNWMRVQVALQLFLVGLFKKIAIADRMALYCDPVLANPEQYNSSAIWLSVLAYSVRIYADFSGYSDMAVGIAHLFGYKLTQNFNAPYLAVNISEFWRRWHISLSTWLRDYLFIPLGGSRGSHWQTNRNLLLTMLLGGLWHGANWSYIIWGGLHGLLLIGHRAFRVWLQGKNQLNQLLKSKIGTLASIWLTFMTVTLCWIFFRPDVDKSWIIIEKMFSITKIGETLPLHNRGMWYIIIFFSICQLFVVSGVWKRIQAWLPSPILGFGYAMTLIVALILAPQEESAFIYFTF